MPHQSAHRPTLSVHLLRRERDIRSDGENIAGQRRQQLQPPLPADLPADTRVRKVTTAGTIHIDRVTYMVDVDHIFKHVLVITDSNQPGDKITITDLDGVILAEHTRPDPGVTYVGNGRPPGTRPRNPRVSPKS